MWALVDSVLRVLQSSADEDLKHVAGAQEILVEQCWFYSPSHCEEAHSTTVWNAPSAQDKGGLGQAV
jgi:hypothetical protein